VALYPRRPHKALLVILSGVLVDIDHYLVYAHRSGDWSLIGALRYERRRSRPIRPGDTRPRYGPLRSIIHRPTLTLPLLWLASALWPALQPVAAGVSLHLALDAPWPFLLDWRVRRRSKGRCERCGVAGLELGVYHKLRPRDGGSYWAAANRARWCNTCARAARRNQWA
jgi:hypothetical protein